MYADRVSEDAQLLKMTTFAKNQKYEHGGRLSIKFTSYFMERTHEPLHLEK
jgi:N-formylglutamate amidohydrolase